MSEQQLHISQLRRDGGTQQREHIRPKVAQSWAEDMRQGRWDWNRPGDPIKAVWDGNVYWLYDGHTRCTAAELAEVDHPVPVQVIEGTLQDAIWASTSVNAAHGQLRTNKDKERAVLAALRHPRSKGMSDREIAEHVGVSYTFVSQIVAERQAAGELEERGGRRQRRAVGEGRLTGKTPLQQVDRWWTKAPETEKRAFFERVQALYQNEFGA